MRPFVSGLICSILVIQLYSTAAKELACGFPGSPAYGFVKPALEAFEEGAVVSYSCRVGYILVGSPISRCTEDGSWTEDVPICDDSMTTLGVAFSTPTLPGHAAEMAIDRDKETCAYLKPKKPRWWRIDLGNVHNSEKVPKVLSVAVTLDQTDKNVKFTIFVIKTHEGSASYKRCASFSGKFGTQTVVMSCAEGKGIHGEKVHIEDHLQTEGLFEICEVEVQVEKETGYDCGEPSRNLYSVTYARRGNKVDYGCVSGYEINGIDYRTCNDSGHWSGNPPVCEPILCDELEPFENGNIRLSHEDGPPLEGAIAIYKCDEGYKLMGSFTRHCLRDGSWSGKPPHCKAIRCPLPDGQEVGGIYRLVNKTNSMGSMALLRCKKGKREGDNPYIICTEDEIWTKPESHCILPAGASYERKEEPKIANQGAIIFGMIVAAIMIVVVLVAMYLYTQKRRDACKPKIPSRFAEPPAPPPRPPPRSNEGGLRSALMGFISRDSDKPEDKKELQNSWKGSADHGHSDEPAVIEVEVLPQKVSGRKVYPVPEENETASLENVVLDMDGKGSTKDASQKSDYASVDYNRKRQSRLLKDQDSIDSSSTAAASPLPPDEDKKISRSPTPPKESSEEEEESEEEESDQSEKRKQEEEERKAKEEEERKAKEEEERKAKEEEERKAKEEEERKAKEEEEKKEKEATAPSRRRRVRDEPPPPPAAEERPVLRRVRRL